MLLVRYTRNDTLPVGTTVMAHSSQIDFSVVADPHHYANHGVPFHVFDALRERDGLTLIESKKAAPFWAVSRYDDIRYVGQRQELFHNSPRLSIEADPNSSGV